MSELTFRQLGKLQKGNYMQRKLSKGVVTYQTRTKNEHLVCRVYLNAIQNPKSLSRHWANTVDAIIKPEE